MRIIIAGAGDIGIHLARLLSHEQQDIVLIDQDLDVLHYVATHLDVHTIHGDSASINILNEAEVAKASLFLALTTEKNNLVSCILAKKMGAKQTIARVSNPEYLTKQQRSSFKELGIDSIICPPKLAALEVVRLIEESMVTDLFEFENGLLTLAGFIIDATSPLINYTLEELSRLHPNKFLRPITVLRGGKTIVPKPDTVVQRRDHIYFLTSKEQIREIAEIAGKDRIKVKNVMIIGGTELGLKSAQMLEEEHHVIIVEKSKQVCKSMAETLKSTLIVNGDPNNLELLREEGLERVDAFVALTANSETNIITSLLAEEKGVYKTIAHVDNMDYTRLSQNIGVETIINQKLIAANYIFRFVRKGKIEAIASMHGVDAEVIEFIIQKENRVTKNAIKDLHLPKQAIVAGIIRGVESIFPTGNTVLEKGDKVLVFARHEAIPQIEKIFR